jgi:hypothetical protein
MTDNPTSTILSREAIIGRAEKNWNDRDETNRIRAGNKYKHIFQKFHMPENDWKNDFNKLTESQQSILVKGELIRMYDGLPNRKKTMLKHQLGLSAFSTKWFKLPPGDKKTLLTSITR